MAFVTFKHLLASSASSLLDVYVPEKPASTALPVLVNIHGGGYTTGGADEYPWGPIVDASRGSIIAVSTQYRLGGYRFLSGSEVREHGQANAGFLDQRAALECVQPNIRSFGGDPSKVSILGGSAGGGPCKTLDTCTWKISH